MWDWAIWGALILVILVGIATVALLGVRALAAWRNFKGARRDVVGSLDDLAAKGEATAAQVATAGETADLQESLGRLRISLARLALLREALDEAHDTTVGRVTGSLPGK
jgi:hypothetical protein